MPFLLPSRARTGLPPAVTQLPPPPASWPLVPPPGGAPPSRLTAPIPLPSCSYESGRPARSLGSRLSGLARGSNYRKPSTTWRGSGARPPLPQAAVSRLASCPLAPPSPCNRPLSLPRVPACVPCAVVCNAAQSSASAGGQRVASRVADRAAVEPPWSQLIFKISVVLLLLVCISVLGDSIAGGARHPASCKTQKIIRPIPVADLNPTASRSEIWEAALRPDTPTGRFVASGPWRAASLRSTRRSFRPPAPSTSPAAWRACIGSTSSIRWGCLLARASGGLCV